MTSGFVAVVPHNKWKHVKVYEVIPAENVHRFREMLFLAYDQHDNRFPVLGEDRALEFEQYWFWPRKISWATARYDLED